MPGLPRTGRRSSGALHDWENAAASIPGVQLTHGILARLEPDLVQQLQATKPPARLKRG
jgi:hypothetical protein